MPAWLPFGVLLVGGVSLRDGASANRGHNKRIGKQIRGHGSTNAHPPGTSCCGTSCSRNSRRWGPAGCSRTASAPTDRWMIIEPISAAGWTHPRCREAPGRRDRRPTGHTTTGRAEESPYAYGTDLPKRPAVPDAGRAVAAVNPRPHSRRRHRSAQSSRHSYGQSGCGPCTSDTERAAPHRGARRSTSHVRNGNTPTPTSPPTAAPMCPPRKNGPATCTPFSLKGCRDEPGRFVIQLSHAGLLDL